MRKVFLLISILLCLTLLVGCDPALPAEKLQAIITPSVLFQSETAEIEIIYPEYSNMAVTEWLNQTITIISGEEFIGIDGTTVIGLSPGIAVIQVEATAKCENWFLWFTDEYPFTASAEVEVVAK